VRLLSRPRLPLVACLCGSAYLSRSFSRLLGGRVQSPTPPPRPPVTSAATPHLLPPSLPLLPATARLGSSCTYRLTSTRTRVSQIRPSPDPLGTPPDSGSALPPIGCAWAGQAPAATLAYLLFVTTNQIDRLGCCFSSIPAATSYPRQEWDENMGFGGGGGGGGGTKTIN
jgi:hypothetical protein